MRDLERFIVLQTVDVRWREHLENMDYMREGIHLRGMAQKDPLVEYRNEGHAMFLELNRAIREEVVDAPLPRGDHDRRGGPRSSRRRTARQRRHELRAPVARGRGGDARRRRQLGGRDRGVAGGGSVDDAAEAEGQHRARDDRPQRPVLLRLRQEIQEVPRGVSRPNPPLADDTIRLEPLTQAHAAEFVELVKDSDVKRFTLVPSGADGAFVRDWLGRYESGWLDASRAGFCIRGADDGAFYGFAAIVHLDLDAREGEIGYMVVPAARGRGASVRAVELLTRWGFDDARASSAWSCGSTSTNTASERVAERAGYRRDGILRNVHFKEGLRSDTGVWSRLRTD